MIDVVQCTYCDSSPPSEEDHVVARQFFPSEDKFRGGLPKVPACGECNRIKQRVEDTVAVYLQFGHASEASTKVLEGRVPRTLQKNRRLARSLTRVVDWRSSAAILALRCERERPRYPCDRPGSAAGWTAIAGYRQSICCTGTESS